MPYFTVFTSTYNRGYTLFRLYESLKNQGTTDFEWLIVNDGSTDNTHQLVEEWIRKEKEFSIRYLEKENGGKENEKDTQNKSFDCNNGCSSCIINDSGVGG